MAKFFVVVFVTAFFLLMAVPLLAFIAIANGWAVSVLWGWFVAPVFGIPLLSVPQAIGFGILVSFMTISLPKVEKAEDGITAEKVAGFVTHLIRPFLAVLMGWIVTFFL